MTVKKCELRATFVQIGVNVIAVTDGREIFCVEQPDEHGWIANGGDSNRSISSARPVDVFVQAIMTQIVSVAASRICRADPDRICWNSV